MSETYLDIVFRSSLLPFHYLTSIADSFLLKITMHLYFEKIISSKTVWRFLTLVDTYVDWISKLVLVHIIVAKVASCLCMLESNKITREDELRPLVPRELTIWYHLPFEEIGRTVDFESLIEWVRIDSPLWTQWTIFGWLTSNFDLFLHMIHRNV